MTFDRRLKYILFSLTVGLILVFIFKADWLMFSIRPGFPVGTLISWLLLDVYTFLMFLLFKKQNETKPEKFLSCVLKFNFLMSFFWGLISFFLSGNWSFNFDEGNKFIVWVYYTAAIVLLPVAAFFWKGIVLLYRLIEKRN